MRSLFAFVALSDGRGFEPEWAPIELGFFDRVRASSAEPSPAGPIAVRACAPRWGQADVARTRRFALG